jgi:hypothetical protein
MLRLTFTDMLFTGDGEAFNVCSTPEGCVEKDINVGSGRTIPRRRITSRLGKFRHRSLHRIISRWSCMVDISLPPSVYPLTSF